MKEIIIYPDPFLKTKATLVKKFDENLNKKVKCMIEVMEYYDGLGLASIQIGMPESIIIYRDDGILKHELKVLVNSKISSIINTDLQRSEEGCLSIPKVFIPIRRYKEIEVFGFDKYGKKQYIKASGMLSNILQHEIDHLNGILMIDRLSRLQKNIFKKRLKGLKS